MATQAKLIYDDEFEALNLTIAQSGHSVKAVAQHLWPEMKPESAYARLKSCLSNLGDQRLTLGQVCQVMRFCGNADALYWLCDELSFERPKRVAPEDRQAALIADFNRHVEMLERLSRELGVGGVSSLKAVR